MKIYQLMLVVWMALVLAACGGTSRRAAGNSYYNGYGYGGYYYANNYGTYNYGTYNGTAYNINNYGYVSNLSNMVASTLGLNCSRLPDFVAVGQVVANNTIRVAGNGGTVAGDVSDIFVGRNSYGDLLIVAKIANGNNIYSAGYNIIVSYCIDNQTFYAGSQVTSFNAPYYITLTVNANGAFGGAVANYTETYTTNSPSGISNSFYSILN